MFRRQPDNTPVSGYVQIFRAPFSIRMRPGSYRWSAVTRLHPYTSFFNNFSLARFSPHPFPLPSVYRNVFDPISPFFALSSSHSHRYPSRLPSTMPSDRSKAVRFPATITYYNQEFDKYSANISKTSYNSILAHCHAHPLFKTAPASLKFPVWDNGKGNYTIQMKLNKRDAKESGTSIDMSTMQNQTVMVEGWLRDYEVAPAKGVTFLIWTISLAPEIPPIVTAAQTFNQRNKRRGERDFDFVDADAPTDRPRTAAPKPKKAKVRSSCLFVGCPDLFCSKPMLDHADPLADDTAAMCPSQVVAKSATCRCKAEEPRLPCRPYSS